VGQTSKRIGELGRSSERIAQIAAVIADLAGQRNSLLLNALIKTAGASEKGRGFVRVTDEATTLSERTIRAAKEIGVLVAQIQIGSRSVMASLGAGTGPAGNNAQDARCVEEFMHGIILDCESLNESVTRIATVAERQISAIEQIGPSLDQISKVTFESSASAQRSADVAEQLTEVVEELQNFATCFPTREAANRERNRPVWSRERADVFPVEIAAQSNGRTINGISAAPRASVNPGRARIHARLVTPEANPESQSRAPSAAS
jgi:aerotaxis receptor